MAELLKTTFLDEGSNPVFQPRTQTCIAGIFITESEGRRALGCLGRHKGADPDGLFPELVIALNPLHSQCHWLDVYPFPSNCSGS